MKSYLKEYLIGTKVWENKAGKRHNENGPAVIYPDGTKYYYINGLRHREDGPAIEWDDGDKEYYINNRLLTPQEFKKYVLKKRLQELI